MLQIMIRWARALPSALVLLALTAAAAVAAGPPFPDPETDRAVYDEAGVLRPEVIAELESRIDAVEASTGAEIYVYTQVDPGISEDENLANAAALMDQWGIGRSGFDDGLVLMVGLNDDRVHGKVSLYGGSGFISQHIDENELTGIIESDFVPRAADGDLNAATLDTIEAVQERMAPDTIPLTVGRVANAALGLIGAPLALLVTLGGAWWKWRREGDDPELTDSPSILMAGPPAEMTPPLATVVRAGRANAHSTNTLLAELAGTGRLSFHNLDKVRGMHSDDEPDPLTDPAIELRVDAGDDDRLPRPEREAWEAVKSLAGGSGRLSRERLWKVNSEMGGVRRSLEEEAMRLGWFTQLPSKVIGRSTAAGDRHRHRGRRRHRPRRDPADERGRPVRRRAADRWRRHHGFRAGDEPALDPGRLRGRHAEGVPADAPEDHGPGAQHGRGDPAAGDRQAGRHARQGRRVGHGARVARRGGGGSRPRPRGAAEGDRLTGRRLLPALARFELGLGLRLVGRFRGRPRRGRQRRFRQHLLRLRHP